MADPFTLTAISIGSSIIGGGVSAMGAIQAGNSQAAMYGYQSGVAQMNAQIMKQNADFAIATGEVQAQEKGMEARFKRGETIAQQGAGGLAVGGGTNQRVVDSELQLGQYDQAMIRSNAARKAYGYQVEEAKYQAESVADQYAAKSAKTAGYLKAFGSLVGSAGSVSAKWLGASNAGVFGNSGGGMSTIDQEAYAGS